MLDITLEPRSKNPKAIPELKVRYKSIRGINSIGVE
jgi:hypothetical protein